MNEGSYLSHTQGKKHQTNLARRAAREQKESVVVQNLNEPQVKKNLIKIGRPGYKVTKIKNNMTRQYGLLFQIQYPEIHGKISPRYRFMASFEQKLETPDKNYQYILFAAEPYETIAFKIPSTEIDRSEGQILTHWDIVNHQYTLQFLFKSGLVPINHNDNKATLNDHYLQYGQATFA
jgi:splicing factor 3A subunit 2